MRTLIALLCSLTAHAQSLPLVPSSEERQAIANHYNGAFLVTTAILSFAGTIALSEVAAHVYDCRPSPGWFSCGLHLFADEEHAATTAGAAVAATMTLATGIAGGVLLYRSRRIVPTAGVSRDGGFGGVRVSF